MHRSGLRDKQPLYSCVPSFNSNKVDLKPVPPLLGVFIVSGVNLGTGDHHSDQIFIFPNTIRHHIIVGGIDLCNVRVSIGTNRFVDDKTGVINR